MALYFLDTSALVKRYAQENGTNWVRALAAPAAGHTLFIAQITGIETVAALSMRLRRGSMTSADVTAAIADFRTDFADQYAPIRITPDIISRAMDLAEKHPLRGYDAVQLACASEAHQERIALLLPNLTFLSADTALNAAAVAEGLAMDDPNAHP